MWHFWQKNKNKKTEAGVNSIIHLFVRKDFSMYPGYFGG